MEMHQIRYFLAVARCIEFHQGRRKMQRAQPWLTRAIELFEEELGGPLFHRQRANTYLSELGKMVMPHLKQIYDDSHETKRLARDFTSLRPSTFKLDIMCTIAPDQIIESIGHPGFELQLSDANAWQLQERFVEGRSGDLLRSRPGTGPAASRYAAV